MKPLSSDQWEKEFISASPKGRYELVIETIDELIPQEYIDKLDIGMYISDTFNLLLSNNLIPEMLDLIEKFQTKQPSLYEKEFQYFDEFMINYYLYKNNREKVVEYLSRFAKYPVESIEMLLGVLAYLKLYEYDDVLFDLCKKIYEPIKKSKNSEPEVDNYISTTIYSYMIENAYKAILNGELFDWDTLFAQSKEYGIRDDNEFINEIKSFVTEELTAERVFADFSSNRKKALNGLLWIFMKRMFAQKNMKFVCSEAIYNNIINFLENRNLSNRKEPNIYFSFSKQELGAFIVKMFLLSNFNRQSEAFGMLWGMLYMYDFLASNKIITDIVYEKALKIIKDIKLDIIEFYHSRLWMYDFVNRWTPPDNLPANESTTETFSKAFDMRTPLSDIYISSKKKIFTQVENIMSADIFEGFFKEAIDNMNLNKKSKFGKKKKVLW